MTNKKLTKKDYFTMLLAINEVSENSMLVDFINHELDLLMSKSTNRKPTDTQIANENIKKAIYEKMVANKGYTITDLIKEIPECADLTNQRVSALVRTMKDTDKLIRREEIKGKAYFYKI